MKVLDHGYLDYVDHMGTDESVICAARMSTGGTVRNWVKDIKLLGYLWREKHVSPFEFCQLAIEVKLPVFVARQWMRHQSQYFVTSYNEHSGRYSPMCEDMYLPTVERLMDSGGANKQAGGVKGAPQLDLAGATQVQSNRQTLYALARAAYESELANGVPKELARLVLPTSVYTKMRVSASLRNWLVFLMARQDPHAQWEIRQYADAVASIVEERFPHTWQVYNEA